MLWMFGIVSTFQWPVCGQHFFSFFLYSYNVDDEHVEQAIVLPCLAFYCRVFYCRRSLSSIVFTCSGLFVLGCPLLHCLLWSNPFLSCSAFLPLFCLDICCPVMSSHIRSCPALSCLARSCTVISCPFPCCPVLPWSVVSYFVLSCLVLVFYI